MHHASRHCNIFNMLGNKYENEACRAAKALDIVGERWSLLILRNAAFAGMTRFTDFQNSLKIAPNILTKRLAWFVEVGLMNVSKAEYTHLEYFLTEKGLDFIPVIIALTDWGNKWDAPHGQPIRYEHKVCRGSINQRNVCLSCSQAIQVEDIGVVITEAMEIYRQEIKNNST